MQTFHSQVIPSLTPFTPLTPAQADIWIEQALRPNSSHFVNTYSHTIPTAVDKVLFANAANHILRTHDALFARLTLDSRGKPMLEFDPANAATCAFVDATAMSEEDLESVIFDRANDPFDLLNEPLARIIIFQHREDRYSILCSCHHIIADGISISRIFPLVVETYNAMREGKELPAPRSLFSDYTNQKPERLPEISASRASAFWQEVFAKPFPGLHPAHPPPLGEDDWTCDYLRGCIEEDTVGHLTGHPSGPINAYHASTLAAAWLINLSCGYESFPIGLPVLNRSRDHKQTIGMFSESRNGQLPINVNGTLRENLDAISGFLRRLYRYYRLPSKECVDLYHKLHGSKGHPLAPIVLSFMPQPPDCTIDGHTVGTRAIPAKHQKAPFTFYLMEHPGEGIEIVFLFQRQHLKSNEARTMLRRFLGLIDDIARADGDTLLRNLDPARPDERIWARACLDHREGFDPVREPLIQIVVEQAKLRPDAIIAENHDGTNLSYGDCLHRAQAIARHLVDEVGVRPEDRVAIYLPRCDDLLCAYLGIQMSGAAFVPIEVRNPIQRSQQIIIEAAPSCILTTRSLAQQASSLHHHLLFCEDFSPDPRGFEPRARLDDLAYIIYTSGSTGRPKGVEITHRALSDHISSWTHRLNPRSGSERILYFCSVSFDASIEVAFGSMATGNTIVMAPVQQWPVYQIASAIVERRLTVLNFPPAYLLEFLKLHADSPQALQGHCVKYCIAGGDVMHGQTARLWHNIFGDKAELINLYGPTEVTVSATLHPQPSGQVPGESKSIPIGTPHPGRIIRLLNPHGVDVPPGCPGEIYAGGIGLSRGYRNMPDETRKRFVTLDDGIRYYRTGDLAVLLPEGALRFSKRIDEQVQIRGYRVEPAEIEANILSIGNVRECAVLTRPHIHADQSCELHAWVSLLDPSLDQPAELHRRLAALLPDYMLPQFHVLPYLPKNSSDKIDRKALAELKFDTPTPAPCQEHSLQGPAQELLAVLWREVLEKEVDNAHADFFAMGGHSLMAASLLMRINKAFRTDFPFAAFFDAPTIASTEERLEQLVGGRDRLRKMAKLRLELMNMSEAEIKARLLAARSQN